LSEAQMLALMRRWQSEEHEGISEDALDQMQEYFRLEGRCWHERSFGVLNSDGHPVAVTKLRRLEGVAWVEDVYTVPEQRRRGFARMLVTHVTDLVRSSQAGLCFIVADDNDWPKHLYAAIGFHSVGTVHTFHRQLRAGG